VYKLQLKWWVTCAKARVLASWIAKRLWSSPRAMSKRQLRSYARRAWLQLLKKPGRDASEGLIDTYIHLGGKVGVLCEINCESDFVAKTDDFKQFVRDIAMHIAAANPVCVSREDVDQELLEKEREVARGQAEGKPAQAIEKIVEGKVNKFLAENCLLEQAFVKNPDQSIQEVLTAMIAKMGENMVIKRFARFQIGA
jgi:elongation factor Ts